MRLRIIAALVGLVLAILVVFGIPLRSFVVSVERDRLLKILERDAFILAGHAKETLDIRPGQIVPSLQPHIDEHSDRTDARVVVVDANGTAIATNDASLEIGSNFLNRPEIASALTGEPAVGNRKSETLGEDLVFVAVPVFVGNDVVGAVRFSSPESLINEEIQNQTIGIAIAALLTVAVAVAIAIPVALGIAQPIRRLTRQTERLSEGDFASQADEQHGPTEVRELSRAFNSMSTRLGALIDSQRQFASSVSHQLRTPLTALRLRIDQAQDAVTSDPQRTAEALEASQAEIQRLQEMVDQLLTLSRLEGKSLQIRALNVNEIVRARAEMWQSLAEEKEVSLLLQLNDIPQGSFVEGGLEQVIDNFIDNALTAAPVRSTIVLITRVFDDKVVVEVQDEGNGLTEEELQNVFERFWRSAQTANLPGTGLGLAIVRQLALSSDAKVSLRNRTDGKTGIIASVEMRAING